MSEANNITFAQAKTSFFYRPKAKRKYNTLHPAGEEVRKKGRETATCDKAGKPNDVCPYGQVMLPSAMMYTA